MPSSRRSLASDRDGAEPPHRCAFSVTENQKGRSAIQRSGPFLDPVSIRFYGSPVTSARGNPGKTPSTCRMPFRRVSYCSTDDRTRSCAPGRQRCAILNRHRASRRDGWLEFRPAAAQAHARPEPTFGPRQLPETGPRATRRSERQRSKPSAPLGGTPHATLRRSSFAIGRCVFGGRHWRRRCGLMSRHWSGAVCG